MVAVAGMFSASNTKNVLKVATNIQLFDYDDDSMKISTRGMLTLVNKQ